MLIYARREKGVPVSMSELRRALWPQRALRRNLLLALVVMTSVVLSLVAMHSLSFDHNLSAGSMPSVGLMPSAAVIDGAAAGHEAAATIVASGSEFSAECGGSCTLEHSMVVMGCILALVSAVLVAARIRTIASGESAWRTIVSFTAMLSSLPLPEPPSLHVLSISRT